MLEVMLITGLFIFTYLTTAVLMTLYPRLSRKTVSFGVAIPASAWSSDPVAGIRRSYERRALFLSVLLALPTILTLMLTDPDSPWPTLAFTGSIFLLIAGFGLLYLFGHHRMKMLKAGTDWSETAGNLVTVQTDFNGEKTVPSAWWFIPMALSAAASLALVALFYDQAPDPVPVHFNGAGMADAWSPKRFSTFLTTPFIQLMMVAVFGFSYLSIRKAKQQIDPARPEASAIQSRLFRRAWGIFILASGMAMNWMFCLIPLSMLQVVPASFFIVAMLIVIVGIIGSSIWISFRYGQGGNRIHLKEKTASGAVINRNDDRFWKLGVLYVNADDPALFLEKRFGIGWTMNFGRPAAWLFMAALLLFILALTLIPFLLV